jgi:hypothetical protein
MASSRDIEQRLNSLNFKREGIITDCNKKYQDMANGRIASNDFKFSEEYRKYQQMSMQTNKLTKELSKARREEFVTGCPLYKIDYNIIKK